MANILFTWELGGGLGHVTTIYAVARRLLAQGHRVLAAVRDLAAARQAFGDAEIPIVPAPCKTGPCRRRIQSPRFYGHILHNNGLCGADDLAARLCAWRHLFELFQPDVMLFNHSPTALLASRGWRARRILLGTGFCSPPPTTPLPIVRPWIAHDEKRLVRDEQLIRDVANRALCELGMRKLERLADIYADVDDDLLLTFPELDHFGQRENAVYRGAVNTCSANAPRWPSGRGPRVFAYLKPMPALGQLLEMLAKLGCVVLAHGTWVNDLLRWESPPPRVHLSAAPVDIKVAARECDLAILNATHGATAALLLAGKPILQLSIVVEQVLTARNTQDIGAGLIARQNQFPQMRSQLERILRESTFAAHAERFASDHRHFNAEEAICEIANRVDSFACDVSC